MKKTILTMTVVLAALFTTATSQARSLQKPELSTANCYLDGEVSGLGLGFIFGGQIIRGQGEITCVNDDNQLVQRVPVEIKFLSGGVGFDFSIIRSIVVQSSAVRLTNGAADLIGYFSVGATAGANLVKQGIDFDTAVQVSREPGLSLSVGLSGRDAIGLGVRLHAMTMLVTPKM